MPAASGTIAATFPSLGHIPSMLAVSQHYVMTRAADAKWLEHFVAAPSWRMNFPPGGFLGSAFNARPGCASYISPESP
jgi:hypothetical protein